MISPHPTLSAIAPALFYLRAPALVHYSTYGLPALVRCSTYLHLCRHPAGEGYKNPTRQYKCDGVLSAYLIVFIKTIQTIQSPNVTMDVTKIKYQAVFNIYFQVLILKYLTLLNFKRQDTHKIFTVSL